MGSQVRVLWRPPSHILIARGAAPATPATVSEAMSIQKESDGFPEINPRRRTTKVNFGVVLAVILFFAITIGVAVWVANRAESPDGSPPGPTLNR